MEIVRCNRGHFYDSKEYSACPKCQKEKNSGVSTILETSYFDDGAHSSASASASNSNILKTDCFREGKSKVQSYEPTTPHSSFKGYEHTTAVDSQGSKVQTYGATVPADTIKTKSGIESIPITTPVSITSNDPSPSRKEEMAVNPAVGWLVCIEGPAKGKDYRIVNGWNYIGRNENMEISIPEDTAISEDCPAVISFDGDHHIFYFGTVDGYLNKFIYFVGQPPVYPVYINDMPVYNPIPIKANDVLKVGCSKFILVRLPFPLYYSEAYSSHTRQDREEYGSSVTIHETVYHIDVCAGDSIHGSIVKCGRNFFDSAALDVWHRSSNSTTKKQIHRIEVYAGNSIHGPIVKCGRGHFYDSGAYSSCPKCEHEKIAGIQSLWIMHEQYFGDYTGTVIPEHKLQVNDPTTQDNSPGE